MLLLGCVFVVAAIVIMHAGRNTTFYFDDWNFVTQRLGWSPHILLYPHNEHLSLLPVLVYKLLFETVGLDNYDAFRVVSVAFNLTCGALLFVYVRRRLGAWPALGLATCLVLMGAGAWDIVWPFQIGFLGSMAGGLAALLMLDRRDFRGDVLACGFTLVSLSSSSQGLFFLLALVIDVALHDNRARRLWVPGIPLLLYGAWYLKYGVGHLNWSKGLPLISDQVYGGLSAGSTAATALPDAYGATLALALIACFLLALSRPETRRPRLFIVAAMPLAFFALTALARQLPPTEPRYLYPTAIFVVLLACEALLVFPPPRGIIAVAIALLLGLGALGRAPLLDDLGGTLRGLAFNVRAAMTAGEILQDRLDPEIAPDPAQPQLQLGRYEAAVAAYGSTITWTADELPNRPPAERAAVDAALIRLVGPHATPAPNPLPANCAVIRGDNRDRRETLVNGTVVVKAANKPVEVRLRRFGDGVSEKPQVTVPANSAAAVKMPKDRANQPWIAGLRSTANFQACQG